MPYAATSLVADSAFSTFYMENQGRAEVLAFDLSEGRPSASLDKNAPSLRSQALFRHGAHLLSLQAAAMSARVWRNNVPVFDYDARPAPIRSVFLGSEQLWVIRGLPMSQSMQEAHSNSLDNVLCLNLDDGRVVASQPFSKAIMLSVSSAIGEESIHFIGVRYVGNHRYDLFHFHGQDLEHLQETRVTQIDSRQMPSTCLFAVTPAGGSVFYGESLHGSFCFVRHNDVWQPWPLPDTCKIIALQPYGVGIAALLEFGSGRADESFALQDIVCSLPLIDRQAGQPFAMGADGKDLLLAIDQDVYHYRGG